MLVMAMKSGLIRHSLVVNKYMCDINVTLNDRLSRCERKIFQEQGAEYMYEKLDEKNVALQIFTF